MSSQREADGTRRVEGEDVIVTSSELRDSGAARRGSVTDRPAAPATSTTTYREAVETRRDPGATTAAELPQSLNITRDRVRWGPVAAGFLTALTTLLLMGVLGLAVGLTAADTSAGAVASGTATEGSGTFSAIWGAISAIVAFWLGGFVAGKTSAVFSRNWGAFNGMMVFFLAIPVTLWLAGMGLGGLLGLLGDYAGALNINPATIPGTTPATPPSPTPAQVAATAEAIRNGAWTTLLGLGLGLGAAALGGAMGTRRSAPVDH